MYQSWQHLLFLHWRYEPAVVQSMLPKGLTVETFDGSAWVAVVPFRMRNIRPRWFPAVPHISNFLELNVRTYAVDEQGTPGVWFLSLTANRRFAVWWGRTWFRLPYHSARMKDVQRPEGAIDYSCHRLGKSAPGMGEFCYSPLGEAAISAPESLEEFLVERYILFSQCADGRIATGQVYHSPYQVQPVKVDRWCERPLELDGLPLPRRKPDHALFAAGVDVEVFPLANPHGKPNAFAR